MLHSVHLQPNGPAFVPLFAVAITGTAKNTTAPIVAMTPEHPTTWTGLGAKMVCTSEPNDKHLPFPAGDWFNFMHLLSKKQSCLACFLIHYTSLFVPGRWRSRLQCRC
jgi:hypothetical protein